MDGELFHLPPAFRNHMLLVHGIFDMLAGFFSAGKPRRVWMETGYRIGEKTWLIPGVSVTHTDQPGDQYFEGAPAIAIAVISESTTEREIDRKRRIYRDHGGQEFWVIYPETQSAWVYRPGSGEEFTGELRSKAFPEIRLDLKKLFA